MRIRLGKRQWPAREYAVPLTWSDHRLVQECLRGNEEAWAALIDKYKNLIYSIPFKYHCSSEDAADIFQAVCAELFSELPRLRQSGALRSWLVSVTAHKCFHWRQRQRRHSEQELPEATTAELVDPDRLPEDWLQQLEREQAVREALLRLPRRCQEMIRLLFYEQPPRPYREVAQRLGLATGSIGFIRGRCLERLRRILQGMGF